MKLTKAQKNELLRIIAWEHERKIDLPCGASNGKVAKALENKGLIRMWEETRPLGGAGAIGQIKMKWHFCEATDAGYHAAKEILGGD